MSETRNTYIVLSADIKGRRGIGVYGRIILSWMLGMMRQCEADESGSERVQLQALVLVVLNLQFLQPENKFTSKVDYREISSEDGRWMELVMDCVQWQALV